jgi:hypothetical protein
MALAVSALAAARQGQGFRFGNALRAGSRK